jgi:SAM-dependent methyltransferase
MDISEAALQLAVRQKNIDEVKLGDICSIAFPDNHFDGIWNLGVMEHFSNPDMGKAFSEMRRVLKPGAHIILLWPSVWNLVNDFLWWLFPMIPSLLRSRRQGTKILKQNNFQPCGSTTTIMGDIILVGRKV